MIAKIVFLTSVVSLLASPLLAHADGKQDTLKKALSEFEQGAYATALDVLKKSPLKNDVDILYWQGVCDSKLQRFDEAARKLAQALAIDKAHKYPDSAYLQGQALYAVQEFKKSIAAFSRSIDRNYKVGASLYYIGYLENALHHDNKALEIFNKVLVANDQDSSMKQPAAFQIGEIYFEQGKAIKENAKQREFFLTKVKIAYQKTIAMDAESNTAKQAQSRISDIDAKFADKSSETAGAGAPNRRTTANGSVIAANPWVVIVSQDFKYDTNIVNQADNTLITVSYAGSPYEKTSVFGKYEFIFNNWILLTPELSLDDSIYFRRNIASVYGNDNANVNPALRTRFDHYAFGHKQAAGLLDVEYGWGTRDYKSNHQQLYYSSSENVVAGERVELFPFGSTTLKANFKFLQNENPDLNSTVPGISLSQAVKTTPTQLFMATVGFEPQRSKNEFYDQDTYKFNFLYSLPNLYWGVNASVLFNVSIVDTQNQLQARGYEWNLSPGATLTKYLDKANLFGVNFNYTFTKNTSKSTDTYAYSKNVFGIGGTLTF